MCQFMTSPRSPSHTGEDLWRTVLDTQLRCTVILEALAWWQWAEEEGHQSPARGTFTLMGMWSPGQLDCHGCQQVCENSDSPMVKGACSLSLSARQATQT